LPAATGQVDFGFGVYSLNLLSPFVGGQWFSQIPNAFSAEQHFEGFNYLGFGLMLLIASAASLQLGQLFLRPSVTSAGASASAGMLKLPPSTNTLLLILLLLITVYAFSNQLYWGTDLIYQWNVPAWAQKITGQLRASGRFFWPVAYALAIYSVILIARSFDTKKRVFIFSAALTLQVLDLQPYFAQLRNITPRANPNVIDFNQWQKQLPSHVKTLYFFPKMKCAQHSQAIETLLPVMRLASLTQRALNTGYLARYNPVCGQERDEIAQSNAAHSAYIFVQAEYAADTIAALFPESWRVQCSTLDFASVCTTIDSRKR
jgi:hypothetical protein